MVLLVCTCCDEFLYQPQNCTVMVFSFYFYHTCMLVATWACMCTCNMVKCHSRPAMFFSQIEIFCLPRNYSFTVNPESHIRFSCAIAPHKASWLKCREQLAPPAGLLGKTKILALQQLWCRIWLQYPSMCGCLIDYGKPGIVVIPAETYI